MQFAGSISLEIDPNGNNPIRNISLAPTFPANLQYADALLVWNVYGTLQKGLDLPGLRTLRQITYNFNLHKVALADMTSFSGLQCPPVNLDIMNNPLLTSLKGLERMAASANLQRMDIFGNPLLKAAGAYAPLTSVLGCTGSGGISATTVNVIINGCPTATSSTQALCLYAISPASTACPPMSPSFPPPLLSALPPRRPPPVSSPITIPQLRGSNVDQETLLTIAQMLFSCLAV